MKLFYAVFFFISAYFEVFPLDSPKSAFTGSLTYDGLAYNPEMVFLNESRINTHNNKMPIRKVIAILIGI